MNGSIHLTRLLRSSALAIAMLAAASALVGCASATGPIGYPATWPALDLNVTADGCPHVSGTYANRPVDGVPEGTRPLLTELFARMGKGRFPPRKVEWMVPQDAASATLQLDRDRLLVHFAGQGDARSTLAFRRYHFDWSEKRYDDLYTCYPVADGPRLRFMAEPESHGGALPIYVEGGGTLAFLLKASDGSLIVQWRSESLAISALIVGTHMKFQSVWWRYPPLEQRH